MTTTTSYLKVYNASGKEQIVPGEANAIKMVNGKAYRFDRRACRWFIMPMSEAKAKLDNGTASLFIQMMAQ